MLPYIVEAGVMANHGAGPVLGLVHDLAVIGPVELGHRHERRAQGVRRVPTPEALLRYQVDILRSHPARGQLLIFMQRDEDAPFRAA
jgi:hypothetical protein